MKFLLINIFLLFYVFVSNAQIYNHGKIILENNAKIITNSKIHIYSTGKFNNSGKILLEKNWINQNKTGAFNENKGEVLFTGQSQFIKDEPTEFGILSLMNSTNTKLQTNISVEDKIKLENGSLFLNGHFINLKNSKPTAIQINSGHLISENPYSKIIWALDDLPDNYTIPFSTEAKEQIPINFKVIKNGANYVSFNTYPTSTDNTPLPENTGSLILDGTDISNMTIDRFWYINTNGATLDVKIFFTSEDLNQIGKNNLSLLYYNGTEWIVDTTGNYNDDNSYSTIIDKPGWFTLVSHKPLNTDDKSDLFQTKSLTLFPNPANNTISFKFPEGIKLSELEIRDLLGRKVFCQLLNGNNNTYVLDISKLNNSTYFVIAKRGNTQIYYGKFVKI